MAGSATITGTQHYVLGIGHPVSEATTESPPATSNGLSVFVPDTNDYAGILAAYNAAVFSGGGIIKLLPVTYDIGGNTCPLTQGIHYVGSGYDLLYAGVVDNANVDVIAGTILLGDGTNVGIGGNFTDLGSAYANETLFNNDALNNASVDGIAFKNCSYGLKVGANYMPGAFWSKFTNCFAIQCGWGFWFENMIHVFYDQLFAIGCTQGGVQFRSSCTSAILLPANVNIGEIFVSVPGSSAANLLIKGIEVTSTNGTAGGLAQSNTLQCNRFNPYITIPQSAVCNGTANITVTDGTKFAVGLPITFTAAGATNLTTGILYVVKTIVGNVITIGAGQYSADILPTAGTATVTHQGFSPIMFTAETGGTVSVGQIANVDAEAAGTTKVYIENATPANTSINLNNVQRNAASTVDLCVRNSVGVQVYSSQPLNYDIDGLSNNMTIIGQRGAMVNRKCMFFGFDSAFNASVLNLSGTLGLVEPSFYAKKPSFGEFTYPGVPLGVKTNYSATASLGFGMGNTATSMNGLAVFTGSSPATWTWNQNQLAAVLVGMRQSYKNAGTATLTVTLDANSGTFDGLTGGVSLGKSIILQAPTGTTLGGCLTMVCVQKGASTYGWVIESISNGAIV